MVTPSLQARAQAAAAERGVQVADGYQAAYDAGLSVQIQVNEEKGR